MTYSTGETISAADYNALLGDVAVTTAHPSLASAQTTYGGIYGHGFGQRGYGQTDISQSPVTTGVVVGSAEWVNLRNLALSVVTHQTDATSADIPTDGEMEISDLIQAHAGASGNGSGDLPAALTAAETEASNFGTGPRVVTATLDSVSNNTDWASSLQIDIQIDWTSGDEMRWFFNQGNQLSFDIAQTGGSGLQNANWTTSMSNIGQMRIGGNRFSENGSLIAATTNGYWGLLSSVSDLFPATVVGTSSYSTNTFQMKALLGSSGTGGSASSPHGDTNTMTVSLIMKDNHTGPSDTITGTTTVTVGYRRNDELVETYIPTTVTKTNTFIDA